MNSTQKKILFIAGSLAGIAIIVITSVVLFVDVNLYKPRIEAAASDAIGMEFRINGKMSITFFPGFGISLGSVSVKKGQTEFFSAEDVKMGLQFLPLARHEVRISELNIVEPKIIIERERDGSLNFGNPGHKTEKEEGLPAELLTMGKFVVSNADLTYVDMTSNDRSELKGLDLKLTDLLLKPHHGQGFVKNISFSGIFRCRSLRANGIEVNNVEANVTGKKGVFEIDRIGMRFAGEGEKGSVRADITGEKPVFSMVYTASKFDFGRFRRAIAADRTGKPAAVGPEEKAGGKAELRDVRLAVSGLSPGGDSGDLLHRVSLTGEFECGTFRSKDFEAGNIRATITGRDGVFEISPFTMEFFGGTAAGSLTANVKRAGPVFNLHYAASHFNFDTFLRAFSGKKIIEGQMDFSLDIITKGSSTEEMIKRMNGKASLRGNNLLLHGLDLDSLLSKMEESQNFSLVDVGAFFLAGPLGSVLTKGYSFAGVYRETMGGRGTIRKFVSVWRIENGVARAEDVALSTRENRVAMKGGLNFVNSRFDNVTVAALDGKGCAKFSQEIHGPFKNPRTEKINILTTIAGPALKLLDTAQKFIGLSECRVFYKGSVRHPG